VNTWRLACVIASLSESLKRSDFSERNSVMSDFSSSQSRLRNALFYDCAVISVALLSLQQYSCLQYIWTRLVRCKTANYSSRTWGNLLLNWRQAEGDLPGTLAVKRIKPFFVCSFSCCKKQECVVEQGHGGSLDSSLACCRGFDPLRIRSFIWHFNDWLGMRPSGVALIHGNCHRQQNDKWV
jgi:hypothetical protein